MDTVDVLGGVGYEQSGGGSFTAGSFNGKYALNVSGYGGSGTEYDAVGPISADGVGTLSSTTGIDLNWLGAPLAPGVAVSGTFTAAGSGVFPGTLQGLDISGGTIESYTYYLVDTTRVVAIEVDGTQWGLGTLELQQ